MHPGPKQKSNNKFFFVSTLIILMVVISYGLGNTFKSVPKTSESQMIPPLCLMESYSTYIGIDPKNKLQETILELHTTLSLCKDTIYDSLQNKLVCEPFIISTKSVRYYRESPEVDPELIEVIVLPWDSVNIQLKYKEGDSIKDIAVLIQDLDTSSYTKYLREVSRDTFFVACDLSKKGTPPVKEVLTNTNSVRYYPIGELPNVVVRVKESNYLSIVPFQVRGWDLHQKVKISKKEGRAI